MYINLNIDKYDDLPLLTEQRKIFDITRAFLHLPYSVAEYGCGKRADITTKQLFDLGLEPKVIRYGMIIEPDMSAKALAQKDYRRRPQALVVDNPMAALMDFDDPILLEKIRNIGATVDQKKRTIAMPPYYSGDYVLHCDEKIGFNLARSHIFLILHFYDLHTGNVIQRVLDPMLDPHKMFAPEEVRKKLKCPQGVLFSSSIGGYFSLMEELLTVEQKKMLALILAKRRIEDLDKDTRAEVIREFLNNAPADSIGDPQTWTFDNNLQDSDLTYNQSLSAKDRRERHQRMGQKIDQADSEGKKQVIYDIAAWSEDKLLPLAKLVNLIRVHKSEIVLRQLLSKYGDCSFALTDDYLLDELRGFGVRLRERIDQMAEISKNDYDEIDARTFTLPFIDANIELIKQMNVAGMMVFVDSVGNIHGLLTDKGTKERFKKGHFNIEEVTSKALGFHSHIDTVFDAGKYDGRLGVLSGLEIAHTLYDLSIQDAAFDQKLKKCPILVSAFVNEEMTYTGHGVSMPGSAAVAGNAAVEDIYQMTDPEGQKYKQGLNRFLKRLTGVQKAGILEITHKLSGTVDGLCDPHIFLPKQSIERHCEQADIILKSQIPMTQVNVVMGIRQEDYTIKGKKTEQAAVQLIRLLHLLNHDESKPFKNIRITNGAVRKAVQNQKTKKVQGQHFILYGKKDHAGSTALEDRYDPAVAAAKLQDAFFRILENINSERQLSINPVIGDFNLFAKYSNEIKIAARARNAIADVATISLAITGKGATRKIWTEIHGLLREELNANTKMYGDNEKKDLYHWESLDVTEIAISEKLELTLDVRYADDGILESLLNGKTEIIKTLQQDYDVEITTSVEQELDPLRLDEEKNVSLILDGSIGGSHNPHEAEYPEVVLAGTLLQMATTLKFMERPETKIFDLVQETLPIQWREKLKNFHSGALHDACQIAAGIKQRSLHQNNI
jgi:hypothetical protein